MGVIGNADRRGRDARKWGCLIAAMTSLIRRIRRRFTFVLRREQGAVPSKPLQFRSCEVHRWPSRRMAVPEGAAKGVREGGGVRRNDDPGMIVGMYQLGNT